VFATVIVALIVLWLIGMATSFTLGGLIHILPVVAMIVGLLRVTQGRNPLRG
jgi:F0F1-type ATP synthase assembly protein I